MFDCRSLPNPYANKALRYVDGTHQGVRDWLMKSHKVEEFCIAITQLLDTVFNGKGQATIAFGCIGGFHRSVAMAEFFGEFLASQGHDVEIVHRDIEIGRFKCRTLPKR